VRDFFFSTSFLARHLSCRRRAGEGLLLTLNVLFGRKPAFPAQTSFPRSDHAHLGRIGKRPFLPFSIAHNMLRDTHIPSPCFFPGPEIPPCSAGPSLFGSIIPKFVTFEPQQVMFLSLFFSPKITLLQAWPPSFKCSFFRSSVILDGA